MSDYFERIAREWHDRAPALADWVLAHMVNRTDVWGRYVKRRTEGDDTGTGVITAPFRDERGKVFLDAESLRKHFRVKSGVGVLGLHSASADQTSRWLAIDIDLHDPQELSVTVEGNFAAARFWHQRLTDLGFDPLLMDSNGAGGFHILVLFDSPMGTESVHAFGKQLVSDFLKRGLDAAPEIFPGSPEWDHYGDWLRLPGRHHTRAHYTRVWNDEPFAEQPWLEGHDAIDRILSTHPASIDVAERSGLRQARRTVCLDFDGVLHSYRSGWCGAEIIPDPPIHGAREAVARLRKSFRVVVHSSRCHKPEGRRAIELWLERHGIEVDEVCTFKPPAIVYLDDRAVPFTGNWDDALIAIHAHRR
jgi:hypothetical protein